MHFRDFATLIEANPHPVLLIEGRRSIPEAASQTARQLSSLLARRFSSLRFRSGNATGTDEAFASGVIDVAPERLEIIAPYAGHRARGRRPLSRYESPESLGPEELATIQELTIAATPANRGLIRCYGRGGRAGAQAACLIRDTMKVTGIAGQLPPPTAALFWVDPENPEAGGTGHTIRVCRLQGIPVFFQSHWEHWLTELSHNP